MVHVLPERARWRGGLRRKCAGRLGWLALLWAAQGQHQLRHDGDGDLLRRLGADIEADGTSGCGAISASLKPASLQALSCAWRGCGWSRVRRCRSSRSAWRASAPRRRCDPRAPAPRPRYRVEADLRDRVLRPLCIEADVRKARLGGEGRARIDDHHLVAGHRHQAGPGSGRCAWRR